MTHYTSGPVPMTNEDVVMLLKGGLSDSNVILAVSKGPNVFDTSPAALLALKKEKVPETVIALGGHPNPANEGHRKTGQRKSHPRH